MTPAPHWFLTRNPQELCGLSGGEIPDCPDATAGIRIHRPELSRASGGQISDGPDSAVVIQIIRPQRCRTRG